jgi:hypothetical protein
MPFKSPAQRAWMWANEPKMAEEWTQEEKKKKLNEKNKKKK